MSSMWKKWEERLGTFGADEISLVTSKHGGNKDRDLITQAKCILKFGLRKLQEDESLGGKVVSNDIMTKLVCSETMKLSVLSNDNFSHISKDSISGHIYGSKQGWPALELTPTAIKESRGTQKHKPGIVVVRVFKVKRRKRLVDGKRTIVYEFMGETHTAFLCT